MTEYADLELSLRRGDGDAFAVAMRFSQPGSDTDIRVGQAGVIAITFDLPALRAASSDPAAYGKLLSDSLFAGKEVLAGFQQARTAAQAAASPLRVRLLIDSNAPELNTLYWETLRDPGDVNSTLFTGEDLLFSRYLSSVDWRPVELRAKGELRALVAIANPSNLNEYELAAVARDKELQRARTGLGDIPVTALPASDKEFCTLDAIITRLREGYDILYLVAHGAFVKEEAWLLLEGEDGRVARVSGQDLVSFIRDMEGKPRLIVLASCESAGKGAGGALQALGPRLAEAGVPAIVAMQGSVSVDTVAKFMPVFFAELQKDGRIDRAISVARGAVRLRGDFWMPVLFMRLKSGRIWPEEAGPGPAKDASVTVIQHGDTYNVSNIHGSNLNLGSTLTNVTQSVGDVRGLDGPARDELKRLIEQLNTSLQKASGENVEAAAAVAEFAKDLVENLSKDRPSKPRIKIILGGLKQAAEIAGKGLPDVPPIALQIVSHVSKAFSLGIP